MAKLIFLFLVLFSKASLAASDSPNWEVRTAPIAFLAQWLTLDLSYIVSENWAIGPSYIRYANESEHGGMLAPTYNGTAIGAHLIWAENFDRDATYVGARYYSEDFTSRPHAFSGREEYTGNRMNAVVGRRSIFYNGVSAMAGFGWQAANYDKARISDSGTVTNSMTNSGFFHLEFKIGYLF